MIDASLLFYTEATSSGSHGLASKHHFLNTSDPRRFEFAPRGFPESQNSTRRRGEVERGAPGTSGAGQEV